MRRTFFYRLTVLTCVVILAPILLILALGGLTDWAQVAQAGVARNRDWRPQVRAPENGLEMVLVPAGCFHMGDPTDPAIGDGGVQCFDAPFWIGRYEVTNRQYQACMSAGACQGVMFAERFDDPQQPVRVTWSQARDFARWVGGRLLSEVEWEYAARGPDGWTYPWGAAEPGCQLLNFRSQEGLCLGITARVGSYSPRGDSWVGAADLAGNLWEWTATIFADYPYDAADGREDPQDTTAVRVIRGGDWGYPAQWAAAASRDWLNPQSGTALGFRVCCVP